MERTPTARVQAWPTVDTALLKSLPGAGTLRPFTAQQRIPRSGDSHKDAEASPAAVVEEAQRIVPDHARRRDLRTEHGSSQSGSSAGRQGGSARSGEPAGSNTKLRPGTIASARGLVKKYGHGETAVRALDGVDLDLKAGEFTAIMGPSGSGKSTLMHCMAGLDSVTEGSVVVDELDLSELSERELTAMRRTRIGFIFQSFNLIPTLTAAENITLPLKIARKRVDEEWRDMVVHKVGLASRVSHRPHELSGGQQQRVACARALISRPALIFADEPTGNLDSMASAEVLSLLRDAVVELKQSVVMVTHDATAAAYAQRIVFLADGKIVAEMRRPTPSGILEVLQAIAAL